MTPEIANAAMQFMMRVSLRGDEVPAFNAVMQYLSKAAKQPPDVPPPKPVEDMAGGEAERREAEPRSV